MSGGRKGIFSRMPDRTTNSLNRRATGIVEMKRVKHG
jgi:hypothetical protein